MHLHARAAAREETKSITSEEPANQIESNRTEPNRIAAWHIAYTSDIPRETSSYISYDTMYRMYYAAVGLHQTAFFRDQSVIIPDASP